MKFNYKWAFVLAPFIIAGCTDKLDQPQGPIASSGDDVIFSVDNTPTSRTMYQDQWDEGTSQAIYWGNYVTGQDEFINIYCPDNPERGFAKYKITPNATSPNVAETIVKQSEIGVQWGASGKPYTFYAFYPADRAGTTLSNDNTIRATVGTGQSPQVYKWKANSDDISKLVPLTSFKDYNSQNFNSGSPLTTPNTIYGMPDMSAAVMVARKTMSAEQFGEDVPLRFNVLADVLDITINGPITPNTLGANANPEAGIEGQSTNSIQIQAVTIEVVNPVDGKNPDEYEVDDSTPISGSFDLNMSQEAADAGTMVDKNSISGNPTIQLQTSMTNADGGVYYPTLFVRGRESTADKIDHLRLRAFLIPGQITGDNLKKIRVHLQTNCGDFYQMLEDDANFVTGAIYPVKFGYFETRGVDFNLDSWIAQLDPNIYISELSIPGAWHAANNAYQGGRSLQEMYNAGVRAFEVATRNGTDLMQYGSFTQSFDINSTDENFEKPFTRGTTTGTEVSADENDLTYGSTEAGNYYVGNDYYSIRRTVSTNNATVTQTKNETAYTVPRFWLRLYRYNDNTNEPLSTAIINLSRIMNPTGLMFLEIGMTGEVGIDNVPYRSAVQIQSTRQKTNVQVSGYQYGDEKSGEWQYIQWNDNTAFADSDPWTENSRTDLGSGTFNLTGGEAWAIAVRSCLERLIDETNPNPNNSKPIIYSGILNENTTIAQVQGSTIVKINTNADTPNNTNEYSYLWGDNTPALFSRWIDTSNEPATISLQWKAPVAPYITGTTEPSTYLRWCFSEKDNVGSNTDSREQAIKDMNDIAARNYAGGLHRTFYETSIGGYLNGSATAANCQALAEKLNTFTLSRITNPTRQAVPLGIVFMNYVIPPTGEEGTYNSTALIRAIINNNKAFLLNRENNQNTPAVENNVNSHFNNNTNNPLK